MTIKDYCEICGAEMENEKWCTKVPEVCHSKIDCDCVGVIMYPSVCSEECLGKKFDKIAKEFMERKPRVLGFDQSAGDDTMAKVVVVVGDEPEPLKIVNYPEIHEMRMLPVVGTDLNNSGWHSGTLITKPRNKKPRNSMCDCGCGKKVKKCRGK